MLPAVAFFFAIYVYPLSRLVAWSFFMPGPSLTHYQVLFAQPAYFKALRNTLEISLSVTGFTLLLGYPLAYLMVTVSPRVRALLLACVLVPFWSSVLVRTFAWLIILGKNGLVNQALAALGILSQPISLIHNRIGVEVGMVHVLLPFMVLPLYSVMTRIDPALVRAARSLGARPRQAFLRVFLPLSLPGVGAGCVLVFMSAIGFYITPALLGGPQQITLAMLIDIMVNDLLNWGFGATLGIVLLTVVGVLFALYNSLMGFERIWESGRA